MLSNHRGFPRAVFKSGLAGAFAVFLFTLSPPGYAATILFEAIDLTDTTPGEDLWQYSYSTAAATASPMRRNSSPPSTPLKATRSDCD